MKKIARIGVIGYGRFGSFFARDVLPRVFPDAQIGIFSRSETGTGFRPFTEIAQSDLVIPAVSIRAMPEVLRNLGACVAQSSIVMDVCSVNVFPVKWMQEYLPKTTQIISSHPMFGTSSFEKVGHELSKLTMVMHPVRIDGAVYDSIRHAFESVLNVVEMSPEEHDRKSAQFQFTSHLLGGILSLLSLKRSMIDTESASRMFDMMEVLNNDTLELFEDMYHFNPYAKKQLEAFDAMYQLVTHNLKK